MRSLWRRTFRFPWPSPRRDVDEELTFHFEERTAALVASGLTEEEAVRQTEAEFGDRNAVRQTLLEINERAARRFRLSQLIERLTQDIAYAFRTLRRSPVFTLVVVLTLAIGIGANTAVIGVIDTAFLRKLPVPSPERVVIVFSGDTRFGNRARASGSNSFPDYLDLRGHVDGVDDLAAYGMSSLKLGDTLSGTEAWSALVSANYFSVLGIHAAHGRLILPDEDQPAGAHPVVVISDALWRSRFGADERIVGQQLVIGGGRFVIIGVTPPGFTGTHPEGRTDLWLPWTMEAQASGRPPVYQNRDARLATVIGRLSTGSNLTRVQLSLDRAATELATRWPSLDGSIKFRVARHERLVNIEDAPYAFVTMLLFWAMILLLHLVACSNVASLVLARAASRRRELGVRLCLGASRARIVMHALAEPFVLAMAGGAGGVVLARWFTLLITRMQFMSAMDSGLDLRVLLIVAVTAGATVLVFGLAPALDASRPDPLTTLRGISTTRGSRTRRDAGPLLVVGQVAFSVILLANAAVLTRTFQRQATKDPGFDAPHLLAASVQLRGSRAQWGDLDPGFDALLARIGALPGVRSVAAAAGTPLSVGAGWIDELVVAGHQYSADESKAMSMQVVGPGYFRTLGAKLVRGREFTVLDRAGVSNPPGQFDAVVVNEAMARRFWPNEDPLGKQVAFRHKGSATVVGVVRDFHDITLAAVPSRAYFPILEWRIWPTFTLMVRTTGDPAALEPVLRAVVSSSSMPLQPPLVRSMADVLSDSLELPRDGGIALGICAALALLLTSIGLYGLVATLAAQRRREIGIRLALGARSGHVHRIMIGGVGRLVGIGALLGLSGATALVQVERGLWGPSILFEAAPIALALGLLGIVVAVAAYVPSRRATLCDVAEVLRAE